VKYFKDINVLATRNMDMKVLAFCLLFLVIVSQGCRFSSDPLKIDVSEVRLEPIVIHRYDKDLFDIPPDRLKAGLEKLTPRYRFFLDTDLSDTITLREMQSYLTNFRTREFAEVTAAQFTNLRFLEDELTDAFRHLRWYFPEARIPRVYTYISGGDYEFPVRLADSVLLIALDTYLGEGFTPYAADGLPLYRIQRMTAGFILPGCMKALSTAYFPANYPGNNLLDQMIEAGKRIYFIDAMIPDYPDRFKLDYSDSQLEWAKQNESHVWAAIIENELLYSTRNNTIRTFLADGPFTADFSMESPPRLGEFIGWQIVKSYMKHHREVSLPQLMQQADAQKILSKSGYKPVK